MEMGLRVSTRRQEQLASSQTGGGPLTEMGSPRIPNIATNEEESEEQESITYENVDSNIISTGRLSLLSGIIAGLMQTDLFEDDSYPVDALLDKVNEDLQDEEKFSMAEYLAGLKVMANRNNLMVTEGKVWQV